eukprot:269124-Amphidinium_carterae.1
MEFLVERGKEDPAFAPDVLDQCPGFRAPIMMECSWIQEQEVLDLDIGDIGVEPEGCRPCAHLCIYH